METVLKQICYLIQDFVKLDNDHIYLYNNKWVIPKDGKLTVVVGLGHEIPYSNINVSTTEDEQLCQTLSTAQLTIDIFSIDREAALRKNEVLMALKTNEAKNIYAQFGFYVAELPTTFNVLNELDGTHMVNRYNLTFNMFYTDKKNRNLKYFEYYENSLYTNE